MERNIAPTVVPPPSPRQGPLVQDSLETGAIVLRPEQVPQAEQALAALDFADVPSGDIIKIGLGAESRSGRRRWPTRWSAWRANCPRK